MIILNGVNWEKVKMFTKVLVRDEDWEDWEEMEFLHIYKREDFVYRFRVMDENGEIRVFRYCKLLEF